MSSQLQTWQAWRAGDASAGTSLVEAHFSAVYRFFATKVPDDADDLCQATFSTCIEASTVFRGESSFRAFILGIARKVLLRHLEGRGAVMGGRAVSEISIADMVPSPSSVAAAIERRELLLDTMRTIPLEFQMVLELFYWEDLGTKEIAGVLEVPVGTVKSRLSRAREHLREALCAQAPSPSSRSLEDELRDVVS